MNKPYLSALPHDSQISSQLNNAYFHDSWSIVLGQPDLNVFGRLYMLPVIPAHRKIVPATLQILG